MVRMLLLVVVCIGLLPIQMRAQKNSYIIPGEVWKDTDGNPINAHGGGLLYHDGTYYWYGEYKKGKTILPDWATWECYRTDVTGVGCYSSKDLLNWKFEGIVLPAVKEDPNHDLHPSKVLERPKVIYNKKTGKFVMWAHVESADYSKACAGVAVSDFQTDHSLTWEVSDRIMRWAVTRQFLSMMTDVPTNSILQKITKPCISVS